MLLAITVAVICVMDGAFVVATGDCATAFNETSPLVVRSNEVHVLVNCSQPLYIDTVANASNVTVYLQGSTLGWTLQLQSPLENVTVSLVAMEMMEARTQIIVGIGSPLVASQLNIFILNARIQYSMAWPSMLEFLPSLECWNCTVVVDSISVVGGFTNFISIQSALFASNVHFSGWSWQSKAASTVDAFVIVSRLTRSSKWSMSELSLHGGYGIAFSVAEVSDSAITMSNCSSNSWNSVLLLTGSITSSTVAMVNVTDAHSFQVFLAYGATVSNSSSIIARNCTFVSAAASAISLHSSSLGDLLVSLQDCYCLGGPCLFVQLCTNVHNVSVWVQRVSFSGARMMEWSSNVWDKVVISANHINAINCETNSWLHCSGTGNHTQIDLSNSVVCLLALRFEDWMDHLELHVENTTWCAPSKSTDGGVVLAERASGAFLTNVIIRMVHCVSHVTSDGLVLLSASLIRNVTVYLADVDGTAWIPSGDSDATLPFVTIAAQLGELPLAPSYGVAVVVADSTLGGTVSILDVYPFVVAYLGSVVYSGLNASFSAVITGTTTFPQDTAGLIAPLDAAPLLWNASIRWAACWIQNVTMIGKRLGNMVAFSQLFPQQQQEQQSPFNFTATFDGVITTQSTAIIVGLIKLRIHSLYLLGRPQSVITSMDASAIICLMSGVSVPLLPVLFPPSNASSSSGLVENPTFVGHWSESSLSCSDVFVVHNCDIGTLGSSASITSNALVPVVFRTSFHDCLLQTSLQRFESSCNITNLRMQVDLTRSTWDVRLCGLCIVNATVDALGRTTVNISIFGSNITSRVATFACIVGLISITTGSWLLPPNSSDQLSSFLDLEITIIGTTVRIARPFGVFFGSIITLTWVTSLLSHPLKVSVELVGSEFLVDYETPGTVSFDDVSTLVQLRQTVLQSVVANVLGHSRVVADSLIAVKYADVIGDVSGTINQSSVSTRSSGLSPFMIESTLLRARLPQDTSAPSRWVFRVHNATLHIGSLSMVLLDSSVVQVAQSVAIKITGISHVTAESRQGGILRLQLASLSNGIQFTPISFLIQGNSTFVSTADDTSHVALLYATQSDVSIVSITLHADGPLESNHNAVVIADAAVFITERCWFPGLNWSVHISNVSFTKAGDGGGAGGTLSAGWFTFGSGNAFVSAVGGVDLGLSKISITVDHATFVAENTVVGVFVLDSINYGAFQLLLMLHRVHVHVTAGINASSLNASMSLISAQCVKVTSCAIAVYISSAVINTVLTVGGVHTMPMIISGRVMHIQYPSCNSDLLLSVLDSHINSTVIGADPSAVESLWQVTEVLCSVPIVTAWANVSFIGVTFVGSKMTGSSSIVNFSLAYDVSHNSSHQNFTVDFDGGGIETAWLAPSHGDGGGVVAGITSRVTILLRCVEQLPVAEPQVFFNSSAVKNYSTSSLKLFPHTLYAVPSVQCGSWSRVHSNSITMSSNLTRHHSASVSGSSSASHSPSKTTTTSQLTEHRSQSESGSATSAHSLSRSTTKHRSSISSQVSRTFTPTNNKTISTSPTFRTGTRMSTRGSTSLTLSISASSSGLPSTTSSCTLPSISTSAAQPAPPVNPDPLGSEVLDSISGGAIISGVLGTGLIGAGAAVSAYRGMTQLSLIACPSQDDALAALDGDWSSNLLLMVVGDDELRFVRGAVVGNLVLLVALCAAGAASIVVRRHFLGRSLVSTYWAAAGRLQVPGLLLIPYTILLQPLSMLSIVLLALGSSGDGALAGGVLILGVVVPWLLTLCVLVLRFSAVSHPLVVDESSDARSCGALAAAFWFERTHLWKSDPGFPAFVECFGFLFDPYVHRRQWFLLVEMSSGTFAGAVGAAQILGVSCDALTGLFVGSGALYVIALIALRPLDSRVEAVVAHVNGWASLMSSILALFPETEEAAAWIVAVQLWLSLIILLLAIVQYIHAKDFFGHRSRRNGGENSEADAVGSVGLSDLLFTRNSDDASGDLVGHELFLLDPYETSRKLRSCPPADRSCSSSGDLQGDDSDAQLRIVMMPSDRSIRERHAALQMELRDVHHHHRVSH